MIQWFQELLKLKEIYIFMLAGLVLFPFIGNEAFAQENQSLTVTTLKESYAAGEPVEITGLVETKVGDEIVTVGNFNPLNTLYAIDNLRRWPWIVNHQLHPRLSRHHLLLSSLFFVYVFHVSSLL